MKHVFVAASFLILIGLCNSANSEMYQWTDKDGIMHFSNTPPEEKEIEEIEVSEETKTPSMSNEMSNEIKSPDSIQMEDMDSDKKESELEERKIQIQETKLQLEREKIQAEKEKLQLEKEKAERDEALMEEKINKMQKDAEQKEDREFRNRMRRMKPN